MDDSLLSTSRWIVRRSGLAPNSGWKPRLASQSTAPPDAGVLLASAPVYGGVLPPDTSVWLRVG